MICLLALLARVRLGHADRLDDLLDLALDDAAGPGRAPVEQALADELLGDRRGAAVAAAQRVEDGRHDADRVDAGVRPERLVLDRGRAHRSGSAGSVVGDGLAALAAEAGELDRAGAVVDDRFLLELEVVELASWVGRPWL